MMPRTRVQSPVSMLPARRQELHRGTTRIWVRLARSRGTASYCHRCHLADGVYLAEKYPDLARAVTDALGNPPHGPAAPYWLDLDPETRATQLAALPRVQCVDPSLGAPGLAGV
jgi:hypothetical protein